MKFIIIILIRNICSFRLNIAAVQDMELKIDQVENIFIFYIHKLFFMRNEYNTKTLYENYFEKISKKTKKTYIEQAHSIVAENIVRIFNSKIPKKFYKSFLLKVLNYFTLNDQYFKKFNHYFEFKHKLLCKEYISVRLFVMIMIKEYANFILIYIFEEINDIIYCIEFISLISVGSYINVNDHSCIIFINEEYSNGEFINDGKKHRIIHNYKNKKTIKQNKNISEEEYVHYYYFSFIDAHWINLFLNFDFIKTIKNDYNKSPGDFEKSFYCTYTNFFELARKRYNNEIRRKYVSYLKKNEKVLSFYNNEQNERYELIIKSVIFNFIGKNELLRTLLFNYLMDEIDKSKLEIIDMIQQTNKNNIKCRISIYKIN